MCDISGSMERQSRLLLRFVQALSGSAVRAEAFVFSTRLTRVTRILRDRDRDRAMVKVSDAVSDWAGGTRIGEAIRTFNQRWARRVLRSGAVVVIVSDGWDRGDPTVVATEMARLQRSCYRLVWLNPLAGAPGLPATGGRDAGRLSVHRRLPAGGHRGQPRTAGPDSCRERPGPGQRPAPPPRRRPPDPEGGDRLRAAPPHPGQAGARPARAEAPRRVGQPRGSCRGRRRRAESRRRIVQRRRRITCRRRRGGLIVGFHRPFCHSTSRPAALGDPGDPAAPRVLA